MKSIEEKPLTLAELAARIKYDNEVVMPTRREVMTKINQVIEKTINNYINQEPPKDKSINRRAEIAERVRKFNQKWIDKMPAPTTIEGYAVRFDDGSLTIFQQEPQRFGGGFYSGKDGCKLFLSKEALPEVTRENSPKKVKIQITTKK